MHPTPHEQGKLMTYVAAMVTRNRRGRGLKLNYPEAVALITAEILEGARDGKSVAELMSLWSDDSDTCGGDGGGAGDG